MNEQPKPGTWVLKIGNAYGKRARCVLGRVIGHAASVCGRERTAVEIHAALLKNGAKDKITRKRTTYDTSDLHLLSDLSQIVDAHRDTDPSPPPSSEKLSTRIAERENIVASDEEFWQFVEFVGWEKLWREARSHSSRININYVKRAAVEKFGREKSVEFYGIFNAKISELHRAVGDNLIDDCDLSDDSLCDLSSEVVGRGKEFYENVLRCPGEFVTMAQEYDFYENFAYVVPSKHCLEQTTKEFFLQWTKRICEELSEFVGVRFGASGAVLAQHASANMLHAFFSVWSERTFDECVQVVMNSKAHYAKMAESLDKQFNKYSILNFLNDVDAWYGPVRERSEWVLITKLGTAASSTRRNSIERATLSSSARELFRRSSKRYRSFPKCPSTLGRD